MELAVILLFVLSIAVVSALWGRIEKRRAATPTPEAGTSSGADGSSGARPATARPARPARPARQAPAQAGTSPQAAKEAASLLSAEQHRQIYAALGQGQPVKALKLYAMFTGSGIRASGAAITNMAAHPQPYVRPVADPGTPDAAKPGSAQPDAAKADADNPGAGAESEAVREEEISKWAQQLRPEDFLKP